MFEEKEDYEILDNVEINQSIADKFKTVEKEKKVAPKKTVKVVRKKYKKKPKKIKKEMVPKEFRDKFLALDKTSKKIWESFNPFLKKEEEIVIKIYFFGLTVGHLKMAIEPMVTVGERPAYHFSARMKSAKYYSYFYSLDNTVDSYLDFKTLKPLKFEVLQRESKQKVDDLQLFDLDKRKTFVWYKRIKKGKNKKYSKEAYTPEFFMDTFSAFYFTRGLPMIPGHQYQIPVVSRAKIYMFNMEVMEEEMVKVDRKSYPAYKIKASSISDRNEKKGEVFFWYSTEPSRKLLKFSAKIKIGEVRGELIEYKVGKELNTNGTEHKKI